MSQVDHHALRRHLHFQQIPLNDLLPVPQQLLHILETADIPFNQPFPALCVQTQNVSEEMIAL